jgi:hypothetical protein
MNVQTKPVENSKGRKLIKALGKQSELTKEYWPAMKHNLVFLYVNIIFIIYLECSLKLAKFSMLSIMKGIGSNSELKIGRIHHYLFSVLFLIIWTLSMMACFMVIVFLYIVYQKSKNPQAEIGILQHIDNLYNWIMGFFAPHHMYLFIGFAVLVALNLVMMVYYIETKEMNTTIYEANPLPDEHTTDLNAEDDSDEKPFNGNTSEDDNNPLETDRKGLGFTYGLINMISSIDNVLIIMVLLIVNLLNT